MEPDINLVSGLIILQGETIMIKRAILFGMSNYYNSKSIQAGDIPAAEHDVVSLQKKLTQIDFSTEEYMNQRIENVRNALINFATTAPCDSLNVIYFSGHGGQSKGINYFYPVDFGKCLDEGKTLEQSALNISEIQPLFKRKVKVLIILDACRANLTLDYCGNYSGNGCSTGYIYCIRN